MLRVKIYFSSLYIFFNKYNNIISKIIYRIIFSIMDGVRKVRCARKVTGVYHNLILGILIDKRRYKIRLVGIVGTYPFIYSAVSSRYLYYALLITCYGLSMNSRICSTFLYRSKYYDYSFINIKNYSPPNQNYHPI